jgi:hypothetical protein
MIQVKSTPTEQPQATSVAKVVSSGKNAPKGLQGAVGDAEFSEELALHVDGGSEVNAAEINANNSTLDASSLIDNLPKTSPEAVTPKVFDPSLTKGIENLLNPSTKVNLPGELTNEQVLQLSQANPAEVNPELSKSILENQLLGQVSRSPAIELSQSEIDPQLLNMEDFIQQKSLTNKKGVSTNAYGMKTENSQLALESGLKKTEIVDEVKSIQGAPSQSVNSQQFILDMLKEQAQPKITDVQQVVKVINMSDIKTDNPNQIMNQISDYIVQAKAAKEPTVNLRLNHDELGTLDITVRKGQIVGQDAVAINIGAHSVDGKNFFQQNSKELLNHLNQAGINISDFKVETPTQTAKNDFNMSHQGRQGNNGDKNFGSEQNQRRHDQQRRQDLWDILNNKDAA